MTPQANQQFNMNRDFVARACGFMLPELKVCKRCDCEGNHECKVCSRGQDEEGCEARQGLCVDCYMDMVNEQK